MTCWNEKCKPVAVNWWNCATQLIFIKIKGGEHLTQCRHTVGMWFMVVLSSLKLPQLVPSQSLRCLWGMDEVLHWSTELVTNSSLRWQLREKGLKLAESYSLERLSQRLALILGTGHGWKDWHHWYPVEACWGYSDAQSVAWHRAELECPSTISKQMVTTRNHLQLKPK